MGILFKVLGIIAICLVALILLSFVIYFFNLDMKLISKIEPLLLKVYDRKKKDKK